LTLESQSIVVLEVYLLRLEVHLLLGAPVKDLQPLLIKRYYLLLTTARHRKVRQCFRHQLTNLTLRVKSLGVAELSNLLSL